MDIPAERPRLRTARSHSRLRFARRNAVRQGDAAAKLNMREALRWLDRNTTEQGTFGTAAPNRLIFGTPGAIRTRDLLLRSSAVNPYVVDSSGCFQRRSGISAAFSALIEHGFEHKFPSVRLRSQTK